MQRLSPHVFPELQQQAQEQDEAKGWRAGTTPGGGGGMGAYPQAEESETSFPFPKQSRTYSPPPSPDPTPFIDEGPRVPRRPTLQVPGRGGGRAQSERGSQLSIQRSTAGSRTPTPPSRVSTGETLSPQLLGRRATTDADSLTDSARKYQSDQRASATAQLRHLLSPNDVPPTGDVSPSRSSTFDKSLLPSIPNSAASDHSNSSSLSAVSNVSSFAYEMRRSRLDMRLFRKRSKPLQHVQSKPSLLKPAKAIQRSPSFFRPKVVEDTGIVESTTSTFLLPIDPQSRMHPRLSETVPGPKALRKVQTFAPLPRTKPILRPSELQGVDELKVPALPRSKSTRDIEYLASGPMSPRPPPPRQLRLQSSPIPEPSSKELLKDPPPPPPKDPPRKTFTSRQPPKLRMGGMSGSVVTPVAERPHMPGRLSSFTPIVRQVESYSSGFPPETTQVREFVPVRTPLSLEDAAPVANQVPDFEAEVRFAEVQDPSTIRTQSKPPSEPPSPASKRRNRSSIFSLFRKTAFNDQVFDDAAPSGDDSNAPPRTSPNRPATPGITISNPAGVKRRKSSVLPDMVLPPYFARPRFRREHSSGTTSQSPGVSPMASVESETRNEQGLRARGHNRSSSEQLSPMTRPRPRPRPRHQHTLGDLRDETMNQDRTSPSAQEPIQSVESVTVYVAESERTHSGIALSGEQEFSRNSATSKVPPNLKAAGPLRGRHQTEGKKSIAFAGLRDLRKSFSVDRITVGGDSLDERACKRRDSFLARISLSRLRLRASKPSISMANLHHKSSRVNRATTIENQLGERALESQDSREDRKPPEPTEPRRITAADMEVIDFQQTPYSLRYHDSKRATQLQVRAFVEEDMDEDNEEDDEVVLGFERNVPDHFPNSPLCPLHPQHRSGGKAVCPLHRRYKKSTADRVIRVGPASSRRVVSLQSLKPRSNSSSGKPSSIETKKIQIVFDNGEELQQKTRTGSMGSDGAGIQPSPNGSGETQGVERQLFRQPSTLSMSETRGRKRSRDGCGSDRRRQRVRRGRR